jgi:hypothetical protein
VNLTVVLDVPPATAVVIFVLRLLQPPSYAKLPEATEKYGVPLVGE